MRGATIHSLLRRSAYWTTIRPTFSSKWLAVDERPDGWFDAFLVFNEGAPCFTYRERSRKSALIGLLGCLDDNLEPIR